MLFLFETALNFTIVLVVYYTICYVQIIQIEQLYTRLFIAFMCIFSIHSPFLFIRSQKWINNAKKLKVDRFFFFSAFKKRSVVFEILTVFIVHRKCDTKNEIINFSLMKNSLIVNIVRAGGDNLNSLKFITIKIATVNWTVLRHWCLLYEQQSW